MSLRKKQPGCFSVVGFVSAIALILFCMCTVPSLLSDRPPASAEQVLVTEVITPPTEYAVVTIKVRVKLNCSGMKEFGSEGQQVIAITDFCWAEGSLITSAVEMEKAVRAHCENNHAAICDINVWTHQPDMAHNYPMTDQQLADRIAQYRKNDYTGYECFTYRTGEHQVYESAGCAK